MKNVAKLLFSCTVWFLLLSITPGAIQTLKERNIKNIKQTEMELLSFDEEKVELRNLMSKYSVKVMGLGGGHGSGFQITNDGTNYVLTNKHVCEMQHKGKMLVQYYGETFAWTVNVLKVSKEHDLCLLETPVQYVKSGLKVAKDLDLGEYVAIFGYPVDLPGTFSDGLYSGEVDLEWTDEYTEECNGEKRLEIGFDFSNPANPFIERFVCAYILPSGVVSSTIYPGNSGSPVVNKNGEIVGVAYAGRQGVIFANYMVPLRYIQKFIKEI